MVELDLSNQNLTTEDLIGYEWPEGLHTLDLRHNQLTTLDGVIFPDGIQKLYLNGNQLTTFDGVTFPDLQILWLRYNKLTTLDGVTFPDSLQELYLSRNKLTTLDGVIFPDGIQKLGLSGNRITTLDGVTFPDGLQKLDLTGNRITTLDGVTFPDGLQKLGLNDNPITSANRIRLPEGVTIIASAEVLAIIEAGRGMEAPEELEQADFMIELDLSYENLTTEDLIGYEWPEGLQELILDKNQLTTLDGVTFPDSLKFLRLYDSQITTLDGVTFPDSLQELDLKRNQITTLDGVTFPDSLQELFLGGNKITTLDGVTFPDGLQKLDVRRNQITTLDGVTFPDSLQELGLGSNKLTTLDGVTFPDGLQILTLHNNQLTILDGVTFPDKLKYLGLNRNSITSANGIYIPEETTIEASTHTILDIIESARTEELRDNFLSTHRLDSFIVSRLMSENGEPCDNYEDRDTITLDTFSELTYSDYFVGVIPIAGKYHVKCISRGSIQFGGMENSILANWVRSDPDRPIGDMGLGGRPGRERYHNMGSDVGFALFVRDDGYNALKTAHRVITEDLLIVNLQFLGTKRLGKQFGVGARHGQLPEEYIYTVSSITVLTTFERELIKAVIADNVSLLEEVIEQGAGPHMLDDYPLRYALKFKKMETAGYLMSLFASE